MNSEELSDNIEQESFSQDTLTSPPAPRSTSILPIAIGVIAIFLGGFALYHSFTSSEQLGNDLTQVSTLEKKIEALEQQLAAAQTEKDVLQSKIRANTKKVESLGKQTESLGKQTQTALNQLGNEIVSTRKQITLNNQAVSDLNTAFTNLKVVQKKPVAAPAPVVAKAKAQAKEPEAVPAAEVETGDTEQRVHLIASGETLAKLAKLYKTDLGQIMEANPEIDPRRLQIGQKVYIP